MRRSKAERAAQVKGLEAIQAGIMMLMYPESPVANDAFRATGRTELFQPSDVTILIAVMLDLQS